MFLSYSLLLLLDITVDQYSYSRQLDVLIWKMSAQCNKQCSFTLLLKKKAARGGAGGSAVDFKFTGKPDHTTRFFQFLTFTQ